MEDKPESTTPQPPSDATISRLATAVEQASKHPWLLMWRSFLQGFMTALGATIGTALFFTILVWVFQRLGGVNLLKPEIDKLENLLIPAKYQTDITPQAEGTGQPTGYEAVLHDHQLTFR